MCIQRKIESGLASFTADRWTFLILIYSSYALKGVVATPHYNCWYLLVCIFSLLFRPILPREKVDQAHVLIKRFVIYLGLCMEQNHVLLICICLCI